MNVEDYDSDSDNITSSLPTYSSTYFFFPVTVSTQWVVTVQTLVATSHSSSKWSATTTIMALTVDVSAKTQMMTRATSLVIATETKYAFLDGQSQVQTV